MTRYQNDLGQWFEGPPAPAAALPRGEFSPEQAALAAIYLPFRKIKRDPVLCPVGVKAQTVAVDRAELERLRVTAFQVVNPNPFYVRLRGATKAGDLIAEGEGWLFPPHCLRVYSTQYPSFISTIAVARPGSPILDKANKPLYPDAAPIELFYGIGS